MLWKMLDIFKVSDGTRVEGKCLRNVLIPRLIWIRLYVEMEKHTPNPARFFVRKKYTTFSTGQIVALRSVSKIFPESYDFAVSKQWVI